MNSFLSNVIKGIDNTNILADANSSEFTAIDTGSYIMNAVLSVYMAVPNNKITAFAGVKSKIKKKHSLF